MKATLAAIVQRAITAGLLPREAGDAPAPPAGRPWPVVLMIAFGAWLAALPLIGVFAIAFGESLTKGAVPYVVGTMVLVLAVAMLRIPRLPLFVEQLALPALVVGIVGLGFGLSRDLHWTQAAALLSLIALLLAALLQQDWLRVLLGALAAVFALAGFGVDRLFDQGLLLAVDALLLVCLAMFVAQRLCSGRPGTALAIAAWLEAVGCGWMLIVLAGLALSSGESFLIGGALRGSGFAGDVMSEVQRQRIGAQALNGLQAGSALLAVAAAAWAAHRWPALRRWPLWLAAAVLVLLALRLPALGGTLLLLSLTLTTGRWLRAGAAALAAAWIVGSFYYLLDWPLATKALALAAAGAVLGGIAAWLGRSAGGMAKTGPAPVPPWPRTTALGIGLALLATLAVANFGIARNERLIAEGRPVFIALRPVDPRSLMQGDFMRLNFSVDERLVPTDDSLLRSARPRVVLAVDGRGVATVRRAEQAGQPLAADERGVQLTSKDGRWVVVTDGWFFKEGEAERFAAARFGEFRIDGDGRALLVGLADAELKPLR